MRYKDTRSIEEIRRQYAPQGSLVIRPHNTDAIVFLFERNGKPCAIAFSGKRTKPDLHYRYNNTARRNQALTDYVANLKAHRERKSDRRATEKAFRHTLKVGDILHYSWGYDQTQCEFYQVIGATEFSVTIREIVAESVKGSEGFMADSRVAVPDRFVGQEMKKRVQIGNVLSMPHGCATVWDGRPKHCSWYA